LDNSTDGSLLSNINSFSDNNKVASSSESSANASNETHVDVDLKPNAPEEKQVNASSSTSTTGVNSLPVDKNQSQSSQHFNSSTKETNSSAEATTKDKTNHKTNQSTTNQTASTKEGIEYMIISGGYTDHDWKTFPVYAFPLTTSIASGTGQWIDLSPLPSELHDNNSDSWCKSRDNTVARDRLYQEAKYLKANSTDPWKHADPCAPAGRMGHSSFVHENYLYVFGGLIYDAEQAPLGSGNRESFRLEDVPYVYRLDLDEMFEVREVESRRRATGGAGRGLEDVGLIQEVETLLLQDDDESVMDMIDNMQESLQEVHDVPTSNRKVKGWRRIIPRVKSFESLDGMPVMAASEVLLKSVNRGEMQGGKWNDKYIMYGGLRIVQTDVSGPHASSKVMKGPSYTSERTPQPKSRIIELPLGDVWAYDLKTDAFEKITNSFGKPEGVDSTEEEEEKEIEQNEFQKEEAVNDDDDGWWSHLDASTFPRPRTAHAATVVGDELVIHGGMGWGELYEYALHQIQSRCQIHK
jgi:hypothetical protein